MHKMTIPATVNVEFLKELAEVDQPWGSGPSTSPGAWDIVFAPNKLDDVLAALDVYDTEWLIKRKADRLEELADIRRVKELIGPNGLKLDDKTIMRLTAASVGLMLDPNKASLCWEVTRGNFMVFPRNTVLGLAVASVNAVQACFDRVAELTADIQGAADIATLEAIDINTGWPV